MSAIAAPAVSAALEAPDISNMAACVEDTKLAGLDSDPGPAEPMDFHQLLGRLEASRPRIAPLYRDAVLDPFVAKLKEIGQHGFTQVLMQDSQREGVAGLLIDIAQSVLQKGEGYAERAIDAFEEVVCDLYDGFLSAEDRHGVKPPDLGVISPIVKYGNADFGPYTWPIDATENFGLKCAVVSLPPANARKGLLGWAALGHETGGHDILGADTGLKDEIVEKVQSALAHANVPDFLPDYWSTRIDETASDVLGILNMGPAAGIGLIGFFRGLNAAYGGVAVLRNNGPASDPHPADILRGFLAASTVRLLKFSGAAKWAGVIETETLSDVTQIVIEGQKLPVDDAKKSADVVARAIGKSKLQTLENHSLDSIQNWRDSDEVTVRKLRTVLTTAAALPPNLGAGVYAAHAVAAGATSALMKDANIPAIFDRMLAVLKTMHNANPVFGPLFVRMRGSVARDRAYVAVNG